MNLKKLAEELNLSFSTVSKALRDSHEISESTKSRVVAKANELNYQVNLLASSFRKQKTKTIAPDYSQTLAIATYEVCEELGLNIPNDVKVIAFSNSYLAALLNPPLTAIAQPAFEMGREAACILVNLMEKKESRYRHQRTEIKSELIVRKST